MSDLRIQAMKDENIDESENIKVFIMNYILLSI